MLPAFAWCNASKGCRGFHVIWVVVGIMVLQQGGASQASNNVGLHQSQLIAAYNCSSRKAGGGELLCDSAP